MFRKYQYFEGLTNLKFSKEGFLINILGQVKDRMGNNLETIYDNENYPCVNVDSWDGKRLYRIVDLICVQFKYLIMPSELLNEIEGFNIDNDKENCHAGNVGYRFKNSPLESPKFPGFYYIPEFTMIMINRKGEIRNSIMGTERTWGISKGNKNKNIKGGYYITAARTSNGKSSPLSRHRSMLMTFKGYPNEVDKLVVNHIDGIPGNDNLENLELVTRGRNNVHAYENDLKNQHKRVLVRNVLTNEVTEYYSISETARQLGYPTDETIRQRLVNCDFGTVFYDGCQFKYKSDPRDWVEISDPENVVKKVKESRGIVELKIRDVKTGKVHYLNSIKEVSDLTGVLSGTVRWRLDNDIRKPIKGFQIARRDDERPWLDFTPNEAEYDPDERSRPVIAKNLRTGEEVRFENKTVASKKLKHNVRWKLDKGDLLVTPAGWQVKYEGDDWIKIDDVEEYLYLNQAGVMARDIKTGKVYIGDSLDAISKTLGFNNRSNGMTRAAKSRGKRVLKGFQFRYGIDGSIPWPEIDPSLFKDGTDIKFRQITCTHTETGEVKKFPTGRAASKALNNDVNLLQRMNVNGSYLTKTGWFCQPYKPEE